ncbi:MAG: VTC domain-containing protein, partial [Bacteroidales bacterium]|nr:VTC domain-containing protein [Bacteroidales bacterium]
MKHIIKNFDTISLEKMDKVRLMDRIDTKFIFSSELLPGILENLSADYKILEEKSGSIFPYSNLYFDTPEFNMYSVHHNRQLNRYKVRFREYVDSGIVFLEVKF